MSDPRPNTVTIVVECLSDDPTLTDPHEIAERLSGHEVGTAFFTAPDGKLHRVISAEWT